MKKSLMLVMSACLLAFSSCQKSTIDNVSKNQQTSTTTADQSHHIYARTTWGNLGTIHNDIMQYANDNQTLLIQTHIPCL